MLLIHWSKNNNTSKILKNGISPSAGSKIGSKYLVGVWCFPFSRNKTLNTRWRSFLKIEKEVANYNGYVFRLQPEDFPLYAGDFSAIRINPTSRLLTSQQELTKRYGHYFSPKSLSMEYDEHTESKGIPDYFDFEIIIPHRISPDRIIKVIKDREPD